MTKYFTFFRESVKIRLSVAKTENIFSEGKMKMKQLLSLLMMGAAGISAFAVAGVLGRLFVNNRSARD